MTEDQVREIVKRAIKEQLEIEVSTERGDYDASDYVSVCVRIRYGDDVISSYRDSFYSPRG